VWQYALKEFHVLEKQQCWEAAQFLADELTWRFSYVTVPDSGGMKMDAYIHDKLAQPIYKQLPKKQLGCTAHLPDGSLSKDDGIWRTAITGIVPDIAPPLAKVWQVSAGALLAPQFNDTSPSQVHVFYTHKGKELFCHDAKTGKSRWGVKLAFTPTWLGEDYGVVLVAGPLGAAGLRLEDGQLLWGWVTLASEAHNGYSYLPPDPLSLGESNLLSNFQLSDWFAIQCTQNNGITVAFSATTGRLDTGSFWGADAPGAKLHPLDWKTPNSPDVTKRGYLNKIQMYEVVDGRTIMMTMILPFEDRADQGLDWTYKPRLPTTLTGELPRVFVHNCFLLALLPRNYGYDLERLDPKTGANVWKPAARLCSQSFERDAIAIHQDAVYYASGNTLYARNLANGDLLWKRELPESVRGWRVKATKQALMVFPGAKDEPKWLSVPFGNVIIPVPTRKLAKYPFSLRVLDYKNGGLLQNLQFEGDVSGAGVQFFPDCVVVTAGSKAWGLRGQGKTESKKG
jgi:hypothetical protein